MSTDYKALLQRVVDEAWNKGEMAVLDEAFAENFVYHDPIMPDLIGPEGYKKYIMDVRISYPDFHMTVKEMIQEGDTLAFSLHYEGTQLGASPSLKLPATGKRISVEAAVIIHVANGKAIEEWVYQDWLGVMRQLGVLPQPG